MRGFNFNDTRYERKVNLCHIIYMDEKNKKFYNDCYDPCILGWAMHEKCYSNDYGRFNGRIHTHELVVVKAEFVGHKCI